MKYPPEMLAKARAMRAEGYKWREIAAVTTPTIQQLMQYYETSSVGGKQGYARCQCGELVFARSYRCPACGEPTLYAKAQGDTDDRMTMTQLMRQEGFDRDRLYELKSIKLPPRDRIKRGASMTNRWWYRRDELNAWSREVTS